MLVSATLCCGDLSNPDSVTSQRRSACVVGGWGELEQKEREQASTGVTQHRRDVYVPPLSYVITPVIICDLMASSLK